MAEAKLETLVRNLIKLDEEKLPEAKSVFKKRKDLKGRINDKLTAGENLPENSPHEARLVEMPGRVSYKNVVYDLLSKHSELEGEVQEEIEKYKANKIYRLKYGYKEQLDLFEENQI